MVLLGRRTGRVEQRPDLPPVDVAACRMAQDLLERRAMLSAQPIHDFTAQSRSAARSIRSIRS
jgi:hypothetical protein